jgi:hypothetical protein
MSEWNVLPHEPLKKIDDAVWRAQGCVPRGPIQRVMTVAKRADGQLVVHSAIALDDGEMKEFDALGKVGFILVPNGYHRIDAKQFADRYPDAKVLCPVGVRQRVEEVTRVSGTYDDYPKDDVVSLEMLPGTGDREGAMFIRGKAGVTVVLNDAVFNMPHTSGFGGFILRYLTASSGGPKVTMIAKMALVKEKESFKAGLLKIADTPNLVRIIVSHHEMIETDPAGTLRRAAEAM